MSPMALYQMIWFLTLHILFLQHVDIAALLIKYNTCVNATDKWAFTPLHEAAQKGRTQLCALLLAHGADPTMKNQEGQTPLDLATVSSLFKIFLSRSSLFKSIAFCTCRDDIKFQGLAGLPLAVHISLRRTNFLPSEIF